MKGDVVRALGLPPPVREAEAPGCTVLAWPGRVHVEWVHDTPLAEHAPDALDRWLASTPHPVPRVVLTDGARVHVYDFAAQPGDPVACGPLEAPETWRGRDGDRRPATAEALAALAALHGAAAGRRGPTQARQLVLGVACAFMAGAADPETAAVPCDLALDDAEREAVARLRCGDAARVHADLLGTLLQRLLDAQTRRRLGVHFTSEIDVYRVLMPVLIRPWRSRIRAAGADLRALHAALGGVRVLDPACGTGIFLAVALRELVRLEASIRRRRGVEGPTHIRASQLLGIDLLAEALPLARATLLREARCRGAPAAPGPWLRCDDALHCDWPDASVIVGNPPFLAKNRMQSSLGRAAVNRIRARFPQVPGRSDLCVYFAHRAHAALPPGGRAGLVLSNSARHHGALRPLTDGGTLVEAVASRRWEGGAGVRTAIVCWTRGAAAGPFALSWQGAGGAWTRRLLARIDPALSDTVDVGGAVALAANRRPQRCFQGQTPGHRAFVFPAEEGRTLLGAHPEAAGWLRPYLGPEDLVRIGRPGRYVIDLHPLPLEQVPPAILERLRRDVLPDREARAAAEAVRNAQARRGDPTARINRHHANFLRRWWWLSYPRPGLKSALAELSRYLVCPRYTAAPTFTFVDPSVRPSDDLCVFAFADDYSHGVLASDVHRAWFLARSSSLLDTPRYTSTTVYDSFPWPRPSAAQAREVADASVRLRQLPGDPGAQRALDQSVRRACSMPAGVDPVAFLLARNRDPDACGTPGLPPGLDPVAFTRGDCVR